MTVLKRSRSGMELEMQLLDAEGMIANKSDDFIPKVKKKHKEVDLVFEVAKNMVELRSLPKVRLKDSLPLLFDSLAIVLEEAEKQDLKIFGLSSYPGSFKPEIIKALRYKYQAKVFNNNYPSHISRFTGYHYHYTMPRGVFNYKKKALNDLYNSKTKQSLIDSFNLLVAVDPAATTLMQSSPFVNRKFVAKDSRLLYWRNASEIDFYDSVFADFPEFVELPDYLWTLSDLQHKLKALDHKMKNLLRKNGVPENFIKQKKLLDLVWTAVKINKIGTLEYRGCDMNHPKYIAGMAVIFKSIQRVIHQEFLGVEISDVAIKEPFKIEGNKILIPPQNYIKFKLQPASIRIGFEDPDVYNYTKRFFNFAKKYTNPDYLFLLKPIKEMIDRKKTVSDILISRAKKKGYSLDDCLPASVCADIALKHSKQFAKETFKLKEKFAGLN